MSDSVKEEPPGGSTDPRSGLSLSLKSDRSKPEPLDFSREPGPDSGSGLSRSLKSDRSKPEPLDFSREPGPDSGEMLEEALYKYNSDTADLITTVRNFTDSKWISTRKTELHTMNNIKERYRQICDSTFTWRAESKKAKLQKELVCSLDQTLVGLKELEVFLEAVEKLAVTSVHVFAQNQVLQLCDGADLESVQEIITAAQNICPFLLLFKRDNEVFFSPKIQNLEVMIFQLDQYVKTVQEMCDRLKESLPRKYFLNIMVDLHENLSKSCIRSMLRHINILQELRMDEPFRMEILFQEKQLTFMMKFSQRKDQMLQFLNEVEACAVQLDKMKKGAKISSVAGCSLGAVGGVLSIVGLALIPVTFGASLALTLTGVGVGVTTGVNSIVTTVTEIGVNKTQKNKASQAFNNFMEDANAIQECLNEVSYRRSHDLEDNSVLGSLSVAGKAVGVGKGIDSLVDNASAVKLLQTPALVAPVTVGKVVVKEGRAVGNVSRAASDIPDIGRAALKGPLAMSTAARGGFIALNALFLGMDAFFIVKDSIDLHKGCETEVSKFLRVRADLWKSEIDSWQKIYDSVEKGRLGLERNKVILESPFYQGAVKRPGFRFNFHFKAVCLLTLAFLFFMVYLCTY